MGHNGPYFELIYHDDMVYESWINYQFTFVHKDVLVIMQGCTENSEQVLWIELID